MMNEKMIFTRKMALYLRQHGCKIIRTEPNTYKPEFNVYIFVDNDDLQNAIADYMNER